MEINVPIGQANLKSLNKMIRRLHIHLKDETASRFLFPAIPANHRNVEILLKDPKEFLNLDDNNAMNIPPYAELDFREAAICYAINLPAPSILLTFRGIEGILRSFALAQLGSLPTNSWGRLVERLKQHRVNESIINMLDGLRPKRNRVMHPVPRIKSEWNTNAARQLLENCKNLTTKINLYLLEQNLSLIDETSASIDAELLDEEDE